MCIRDRVDILINNAGVQNGDDIDVNLKGTISVTEHYGIHPNKMCIRDRYIYGKNDLFSVVITFRYLLPKTDFLLFKKQLLHI